MPDQPGSAATDAARRLLSAAAVRERAHALPGTRPCRTARAFHGRPRPARRLRRRGRGDDPAELSVARHPVPCPLAAFLGRRPRSLGRRHATAPWMDAARDGARRLRPRDRQPCCSMPAPGRTGATRKAGPARPSSRSEGLAVASFDMFIGGAFSSRPDDPFRVDAEALLALTPEELAQRLPGRAGQSARRARRPRPALLNRLGRVVAEHPDIFGRDDEPAARRPVRRHRGQGAEAASVPAPRILDAMLAASRPDLAGADRARRDRSRRHLAPSARCAAPGRDQRARAVPQALAMAGLFADRAARMGRDRGRRHRRADRPARIPQRRAFPRYRRDRPEGPGRRRTSARGRFDRSWWNGAP